MGAGDTMRVQQQPLETCTGRGVKVGIIDSGVNPEPPLVGGGAVCARITSSEADSPNDYLDYIGHGTAVAGAIHEKAPDAQLYAVKAFDRAPTTNIDPIVKGIDQRASN